MLATRRLSKSRFSGIRRFGDVVLTRSDPSSSTLTYKAFVSDCYSIGDAPNGGMIGALAVRAAGHALNRDAEGRFAGKYFSPVSVNAVYIAKALENSEVEVTVHVKKMTPNNAIVGVRLQQGGEAKVELLCCYSSITADGVTNGYQLQNKTAPKYPPIAECADASRILRKSFGDKLKIADINDFRIPKDNAFYRGAMSGKQLNDCELGGFVKYSSHSANSGVSMCDPESLVFFSDALPPPCLNFRAVQWVPTLSFEVNIFSYPREAERDGFFRVRFASNFISSGGLMNTDGELWSEDGSTLYATSRQLCMLYDKRR